MADKGDTRNALIISLTFFVILSIGLGVLAYYGFAKEKQDPRDQVVTATNEKAKADATADWERYQELLLKSYIGHTLTAPDRERLASLQARSDNLGKDEPNHTDFTNLINSLNEKLKFDAAKRQPRESLLGKVDSLEGERTNLENSLAKANQNIQRLKNDYDTNGKALQAEIDEVTKKLQESKKEVSDMLNKKSEEYDKLLHQLEKSDSQGDDLNRTLQQKTEEFKRELERKDRKIKELQVNFDRINSQVNPPSEVDYADFKGKVVSVDRKGVASITLGSADFVKPQLTFSIFAPSRTGKAEGQRKGSLEVINVVQPHLSTARITDVTDDRLNPIMQGDLLFNPAWNPTIRQHVAIAGMVDLTGKGRDDSQEFMRSLERQGIVVDAYLDLKTLTVQGPGITRQTSYLVLGPDPTFDDSIVQKTDVNARKKEVFQKMNELKDAARQEGVPLIPLKRFLAMVGYRLPKELPGSGPSYDYIGITGVQRKEQPPKDTDSDESKKLEPKDKEK
jgi:hypothetical protein